MIKKRETNKSDLLILKNKLATFEQERVQTQEQLNLVPELLSRLEKLERYLKRKQEVNSDSNTPKSSSGKQESIVAIKPNMTYSDRELSLEEYKLVKKCNEERESFNNANQVSETEQSTVDHRLGKSKTVILEKIRRGNFWIVKQEEITYLIPSNSLSVNEFNVKTVEVLFECRGFQSNLSSNFKLLQPAIVKKTKQGNNWQLDRTVLLQF